MTLPNFELDPLDHFDPGALSGGKKSADAFIIVLALAFNDMKDHLWLLNETGEHPPGDLESPSEYLGQRNGLRVHLFRQIYGAMNELMIAIADAAKNGILHDPTFVLAVDALQGTEAGREWAAIVDASVGVERKTSLSKFLDQVRNRASFHYDPKSLWQGYETFFGSKTAALNDKAYVSLGSDAAKTRFYFADAAVQFGLLRLDITGQSVDEANKYIWSVNIALRFLVESYLTHRQAQYDEEHEKQNRPDV
jgi:hypothetical protein